jgi:membrane carboxypeptidase/penicillin-binding protein PbpC
MSERETVSNLIENYDDQDRLRVILRIHKEGSISTEEAINLLSGDRNYFLTNTLKEISETLKNQQSAWSQTYPWSPNVVYTTGTSYSYDPAGPVGVTGTNGVS